jgi:hypothetical protein
MNKGIIEKLEMAQRMMKDRRHDVAGLGGANHDIRGCHKGIKRRSSNRKRITQLLAKWWT